jgi:hypothetical protein
VLGEGADKVAASGQFFAAGGVAERGAWAVLADASGSVVTSMLAYPDGVGATRVELDARGSFFAVAAGTILRIFRVTVSSDVDTPTYVANLYLEKTLATEVLPGGLRLHVAEVAYTTHTGLEIVSLGNFGIADRGYTRTVALSSPTGPLATGNGVMYYAATTTGVSAIESFAIGGAVTVTQAFSAVGVIEVVVASFETVEYVIAATDAGTVLYRPLYDSKITGGKDIRYMTSMFLIRTVPGTVSAIGASSTRFFALQDALVQSLAIPKCELGSFYDTDSELCEWCPAGTYRGASLADVCSPCPPGTAGEMGAVDVEECAPCPAGTFGLGGEACQPCPAGTACHIGVTEPEKCPPGTYARYAWCDPCPAGSACRDGLVMEVCAAGSFSTESMSECQLCPPGTYCPSSSMSARRGRTAAPP